MTGEVGGKQNKNEYSQGYEDGHNPSEEREGSDADVNEERPNVNEGASIFDNASLNLTDEFIKAESERYEKIKTQNPSILNYTFVGYDEVLNCSLKHIFMVYANFNKTWPHLENLTLQNWLDKYPLTNVDLIYEPKGGLQNVPEYFARTEAPAPTV